MLDFNGLMVATDEEDANLSKEDRDAIKKRKHEWREKILASNLSFATQSFALVVINFAFGAKTVCWPTSEQIIEKGRWTNHRTFGDLRNALVEAGALQAEKAHHTKTNKFKNYKYFINLGWDGSSPPEVKRKTEPPVRTAKPEVYPKNSSAIEYVRAVKEAVAPSTKPVEASITNAQSDSAPESPKQMTKAQKPVPEVEPVDLKPKFDLNAQLDEIEREQRENSRRDELETVPPNAEPDQRLAGW